MKQDSTFSHHKSPQEICFQTCQFFWVKEMACLQRNLGFSPFIDFHCTCLTMLTGMRFCYSKESGNLEQSMNYIL